MKDCKEKNCEIEFFWKKLKVKESILAHNNMGLSIERERVKVKVLKDSKRKGIER